MKLPIYQADAFTDTVFGGNPAAIVPLKEWISDDLMQKIALENNLSETAYLVENNNRFHIRWFTPAVEVDLCGHATLAAAHILFEELGYAKDIIFFDSKSGELTVKKDRDLLTLNFPATKPIKAEIPYELVDSFNIKPEITLKANEDYFFVFRNETEIRNLDPDFAKLKKVKSRGIICTAKGDEVDFVSRFFAPAAGIDEDPVTGSAHTKLAPYWSEILGKQTMNALQISARLGKLECTMKGDRVLISGKAVSYLKGEITV
ncbi:PhzF family phenazine biosynthesis protein [Jiulongibacter sediminis]|jgi:PhzF family phenazine biosynthesis protein|uniref:PhzF family phenazine biosynthesis protein n=1 Tax=Jiulongibacter sediminis TaxID=1605367 RepID=UPI0026EEC76F|nr:PhzF family phenazine biosynthesis protein [Jiulongibacter sediminis]